MVLVVVLQSIRFYSKILDRHEVMCAELGCLVLCSGPLAV